MTYTGEGLTTCVDFYTNLMTKFEEIKAKIEPGTDESYSIYALLGLKQKDVEAMPNVVNEVLKGSADLTNMITKAGIMHAFFQAGNRYAAGMSPDSSEVALMYETGRNKEEARQMGKALGLYAKEIIPYLRITFEALLLAVAPLVALMIFIPGNGRMLKGYVTSLAWIYMWDPILAILNGIVNISAISRVQAQLEGLAAAGVATNALTINTTLSMLETLDYIPAVAGYLAISAPGIALMLLKGGEITMANIASMMAQPVMSSPPHMEAMSDASKLSMEQRTGMSMGKQMSAEQQFMAMDMSRKAYQVQEHGIDTLYGAKVGGAEFRLAGEMGQSEKVGELGMDTLKTGFKGGITSSTASGIAAEGKGISAMTGYQKDKLDLDMAGTEGTMKGVGGDAGKYTEMKKLETQRSFGEVKGEEKAANTFGLDIGQYKQFVSEVRGLQSYSDAVQYDNAMTQLSEKFGMTKADGYNAVATLNASKTVGAIEKMREHGFNEKAFGEMQGGLDTLNTLKTSAQVNAVGEGAYLDTARDSMINEATKWQNLREFASEKGVSFEGLVSSMNRQGQFSLSAEMAKKLEAGGKAGSYSLSWDESGKAVWTEGKGGHDIRQKDVNLVEVQKGLRKDTGIVDVHHEEKYTISDTQDKVKRGLDIDVGPHVQGALNITEGGYLSRGLINLSDESARREFLVGYSKDVSEIVKTQVRNEDWKAVEARLGFSYGGSGASGAGGARSRDEAIYNKIYHEASQSLVFKKGGEIDYKATENKLMDLRNDYLQRLSKEAPAGGIKVSGKKSELKAPDIPDKSEMLN